MLVLDNTFTIKVHLVYCPVSAVFVCVTTRTTCSSFIKVSTVSHDKPGAADHSSVEWDVLFYPILFF